MARLLAADIEAVLAHVLHDMAIADRRARHREAQPLEIALEPEVRHHGGDDAAAGQLTAAMPALGDHGHDLVTVDDVALLVDNDNAVGITVEADADVGAHFAHLGAQRLRVGRAALLVDVEAVGLDAHLDDLGPKLPEHVGRHLIAGPVRAIDHDAQAVEADVARQRALGELDVALLRTVDALGAADALGGDEQTAESPRSGPRSAPRLHPTACSRRDRTA